MSNYGFPFNDSFGSPDSCDVLRFWFAMTWMHTYPIGERSRATFVEATGSVGECRKAEFGEKPLTDLPNVIMKRV